jgi:cytidine deaminase
MQSMNNSKKQELIQAAKDALKNPHGKDYARIFTAAVLTKKGNIYPAISYFSDTYTLTLHGEHAALSHAASHGESEILAIAIASNEEKNKGEFTNPCHMCKQLLYETQKRSGIPLLVILTNSLGETKEIQLDEMASYPWP